MFIVTFVGWKMAILKTSKLLKITENFFLWFINHTRACSNSNICPKIPGISYPDFSRIFRIRFFPEKNSYRVSNYIHVESKSSFHGIIILFHWNISSYSIHHRSQFGFLFVLFQKDIFWLRLYLVIFLLGLNDGLNRFVI